MKKFLLIIGILLLPITYYLLPVSAQVLRSDDFHQKYTLKGVAVFSRHNARSPITNGSSLLGEITPHEWNKWSSAPSELTLKGGIMETANGQFFRTWLVKEGLFETNARPDSTKVRFYANAKQRTIATARFFLSGFLPVSNLQVEWHGKFGTHNPDFNLSQYNITPELRRQVQHELDSIYGKDGLTKIVKTKLAAGLSLMAEVLGLKDSHLAKEGKVTNFSDYKTEMTLNEGQEPSISGSAGIASDPGDALILQYYEMGDPVKAAWGKDLTLEQWRQMAKIKSFQNDVRFSVPSIYRPLAKTLLEQIARELKNPDRKFYFMCGHDTNITCLLHALQVAPYEAENSLETQIPVGSKIVFEKWADKQGKEFIAVNHVYQSLGEMMDNETLSLDNPPMIRSLQLGVLIPNKDGLYSITDFYNFINNL